MEERRRGDLVCSVLGQPSASRVAGAADPQLDEADAALQKAKALLEVSQPGGVSDQARHRFEKAVARAIADVEDAREQIAEAKAAVDEELGGEP